MNDDSPSDLRRAAKHATKLIKNTLRSKDYTVQLLTKQDEEKNKYRIRSNIHVSKPEIASTPQEHDQWVVQAIANNTHPPEGFIEILDAQFSIMSDKSPTSVRCADTVLVEELQQLRKQLNRKLKEAINNGLKVDVNVAAYAAVRGYTSEVTIEVYRKINTIK